MLFHLGLLQAMFEISAQVIDMSSKVYFLLFIGISINLIYDLLSNGNLYVIEEEFRKK